MMTDLAICGWEHCGHPIADHRANRRTLLTNRRRCIHPNCDCFYPWASSRPVGRLLNVDDTTIAPPDPDLKA